jgi:hypothetical protein
MKWTVLYLPKAQADLIDSWMTGPDRQAVAEAADEIDAMLATDPLIAGESRGDNQRIVCKWPLAAQFRVEPADCRVIVSAVRLFRRKGE